MPKDIGLNPRSEVQLEFPLFQVPKAVGYFSLDWQRFYENRYDKLRYFAMPPKKMFPLDLNVGMGRANKKHGGPLDEGLDNMFRFICDNYVQLEAEWDRKVDRKTQKRKNVLFPIEFVCWRGLLRQIMCTPFEYQSDWIIDVTRYRGTFYFCQRETEEAKEQRLNQTATQRRMSSWGYKFEQYCLVRSPGEYPRVNDPVDECSEFACVFHGKVGSHNLLYGAEMDGIKSQHPVNTKLNLDGLEFVELKTSVKSMTDKQRHIYLSYKTRNWWCQSFLVGVQNVIVGWRDCEGFVRDIEEIKVSQLSKIGKNWTATKCARFLVTFLDRIKVLMANVDSPTTVWQFKYIAKQGRITYDVLENRPILADFYVDFIDRLPTHSRNM